MIDLNVRSLTELCRLALPPMLERRRGFILNVASTAAFQAGPYSAVYYATKAYVLSLSEALHEESKAKRSPCHRALPRPDRDRVLRGGGEPERPAREDGDRPEGGRRRRPRRPRPQQGDRRSRDDEQDDVAGRAGLAARGAAAGGGGAEG